ncbi:uncharacterized protein [Euphorbia lathyris]|uniref:uncharacterized protein n=1 Tax=Euphorbia lathyris TaxID=212925 RepID=UPI00331437DA
MTEPGFIDFEVSSDSSPSPSAMAQSPVPPLELFLPELLVSAPIPPTTRRVTFGQSQNIDSISQLNSKVHRPNFSDTVISLTPLHEMNNKRFHDGNTSRHRSSYVQDDHTYSLQLTAADNPGTVLVTVPLNGSNYVTWRRAMLLALSTKEKLDFVLSDDFTPSKTSPDFHKWHRADCMVMSWILNAISKDLADAFVFSSSARTLWKELEQRFGGSNGPLLYQLKREINACRQGNLSIALYFTKLKRSWDELAYLCPVFVCSCEASHICTCLVTQKMTESHNTDKLVQFLMGLHSDYSPVIHQLLLLDPLPSLHKAYSMLQNVEKQREVNSDHVQLEIAALATKSSVPTTSSNLHGQKRDSSNKADRFCTHCNKPGHEKDSCFKLHGFPEWFQEFKKKKNKNSKTRANHVSIPGDTPLDGSDSENKENMSSNYTMPHGFAQLVQTEVQRVMKNKNPLSFGDEYPANSSMPLANFSGFAGPSV